VAGIALPALLERFYRFCRCDGIQKIIFDSIDRCIAEFRKDLCENNNRFVWWHYNGTRLRARLERESTGFVPPATNVDIVAQTDRENGVWVGGSVLGSVP
jgi:hypothetical protein